MGDEIHFDIESNIKCNIFAHTLIAFYPDEGFMIFEGYMTPKPIQLPIITDIFYRNYQLNISKYYKIEIKKIWWKDLQEDPTKSPRKCSCDPNSDELCECFIRFFPSNIIIIEFNVLDSPPPYDENQHIWNKINWDYTIDWRYKSPSEMLVTYKKLLGLPEDMYQSYLECKEDRVFYIGYYAMRKEYANKYSIVDEGELKEIRDAIHFSERILSEKRKEKQKSLDNSIKNTLSVDSIIGVNTVAKSLRNITSGLIIDDIEKEYMNDKEDLVARILKDI